MLICDRLSLIVSLHGDTSDSVFSMALGIHIIHWHTYAHAFVFVMEGASCRCCMVCGTH